MLILWCTSESSEYALVSAALPVVDQTSADAGRRALRSPAPRPLLRIGVPPLVGTDKLSLVVSELHRAIRSPQLVLHSGTVSA